MINAELMAQLETRLTEDRQVFADALDKADDALLEYMLRAVVAAWMQLCHLHDHINAGNAAGAYEAIDSLRAPNDWLVDRINETLRRRGIFPDEVIH